MPSHITGKTDLSAVNGTIDNLTIKNITYDEDSNGMKGTSGKKPFRIIRYLVYANNLHEAIVDEDGNQIDKDDYVCTIGGFTTGFYVRNTGNGHDREDDRFFTYLDEHGKWWIRADIYTNSDVEAVNIDAGCVSNMFGSIEISANSLPQFTADPNAALQVMP